MRLEASARCLVELAGGKHTDQARMAYPEIWGSSKVCVRLAEGQGLGRLSKPASASGLDETALICSQAVSRNTKKH